MYISVKLKDRKCKGSETMIYFLQGKESYFIQQELQKISQQSNIALQDIIQYSANEIPFSMLVLEMNSDDIFGAQKLLVLKDLEQQKIKEYLAGVSPEVFTLLHANQNILVIQFLREENLSKTLEKELSDILTKAKIINTRKQSEQGIISFIEKKLKQHQHNLSRNELAAIATKYQNNLALISNELERIMLEKDAFEIINFNDFKSDSQFLEEQVFDLIQVLEQKNSERTFQMLDNILLHQQNVFGLLALLLKNYKEMYQIKTLLLVGYNLQQIATRLNIHPYRTKILAKNAESILEAQFSTILQKIIETEIALKSGKQQNIALRELFLHILAGAE